MDPIHDADDRSSDIQRTQLPVWHRTELEDFVLIHKIPIGEPIPYSIFERASRRRMPIVSASVASWQLSAIMDLRATGATTDGYRCVVVVPEHHEPDLDLLETVMAGGDGQPPIPHVIMLGEEDNASGIDLPDPKRQRNPPENTVVEGPQRGR